MADTAVTITWSPDASSPLILSQEDETDLLASVSAQSSDTAQPVAALAYSAPDGLPPHVAVATAGAMLTVHVVDWVGLFPLQIDYLQSGQPGQCTRWADLPDAAEEVYAYHPDATNVRTFRLVVTAKTSAGAALDSATYLLTVYANYTVGKLALQEAVDARR